MQDTPEFIKNWKREMASMNRLSEIEKDYDLLNNKITKSIEEKHYPCPICVSNCIAHSHALINANLYRILEDFTPYLLPNGNERSIQALCMGLKLNLQYLSDNLFDTPNNFEAYVSLARNVIEKIAVLDHILKRGDRSEALSNIYNESTYDIYNIITAKSNEIDEIIGNWKAQSREWTNSSAEDRIGKLVNSRDVTFIYAYISRIAHSVNRDSSLKYNEDKIYISFYVYIFVIMEYLNIIYRSQITDSVKTQSDETLIKLVGIWSDVKIPIKSILTLSSFSLKNFELSDAYVDFATKHNTDLINNKVFQYYGDHEHIFVPSKVSSKSK